MRVEEIMTRDVRACEPKDTLQSVARTMRENDCGCLPVTRDGECVGMVTDRDICLCACEIDQPLSAILVEKAMSENVLGCSADDSIEEAEKAMQKHQIRRLPVLDEDRRLQGFVALGDLARATKRKGQKVDRKSLADTLSAISRPTSGRRVAASV